MIPATTPMTAIPVGLVAPPVEADAEPAVAEAIDPEAVDPEAVDAELIIESISLVVTDPVIIELRSVRLIPLVMEVKLASELSAEPRAEETEASALVATAEAEGAALVAPTSSVTSWPSERMPTEEAMPRRSL